MDREIAQPFVLDVENLSKSYGQLRAVSAVSFRIRHGEILGLLGPNGAGKTTIINTILGVLAPTSGSIRIGDFDVERQRAQALARSNFAAVYATLPGNLTVRQNLRFFGLIYAVRGLDARVDSLLQQFQLQQLAGTKCGLLSSGEQTRVALAKALLNEPELLLLDEPTASLDPDSGDWVRGYLEEYRDRTGATILLASHNMAEVERLCSEIMMMKAGHIVDRGSPDELIGRYGRTDLEEVFLHIARDKQPVLEPVS